jgi:gliding motility-associated-like protein
MSICRQIFLLVTLLPTITYAQYVSNNGNFQVSEIKGCVPLTLTFTNLKAGACTGGSPCDVKFEVTSTAPTCAGAYSASPSVPSIQNPSSPYTFTQAGTFRMIVLYQGECDEITITVTPNIKPAFDVFTCGNNEVQVQVTDTNYENYLINYNDGSPIIQSKNHQYQYASSGAKNISVRGINNNAANNCSDSTKSIVAVAALSPPFINQLAVNNNGADINLTLTNSPNVLYRLEIAVNSTNFQFLKMIHNVSTTSIGSLRTNDNYYCFRLGTFDPCNNQTFYSNVICSTNFSAQAQNNQNQLNWITNSIGPITNFTIVRDGTTIATQAGTSYTDTNVICNTSYQYQIISNYANGSTSLSSQKTVTAFSNNVPTAINNVSAEVTGNSVNLNWQQDPNFTPTEYSVFRKSNANYSLQRTTPATQFTDTNYSTGSNYCYRIQYQDVCNNDSATGIDACPIQLSASVTKDNTINLNWSAYTGWTNGVNQYTVEKYDAQGMLISTVPVGTSTTYSEPNDATGQVYIFIIRADANDAGLSQAVSNSVEVLKEPNIFYPRAFTPDGMGPSSNELFNVYGQYVVTFEMKIFNRWGELMFTTNDITEGWDGNFKGKKQPEGTYAFIAHITDTAGRTFIRSGSVVLLRKK